MVRNKADTAVKIPIFLKVETLSWNHSIEKRTGNTKESLFASVVMVMPAFWDEFPIRKNMPMKRVPKTIPDGSKGFKPVIVLKSNCKKNPNPNKLATR